MIDLDYFFYYGEVNLNDEIQNDVLAVLIQPKRSLYFNRSNDSAGIEGYENYPISAALQILVSYDIMSAMGKRNLNVSDGSSNTKDRRIAISDELISVEFQGEEINVSVRYISLNDLKTRELIIPVGLGVSK